MAKALLFYCLLVFLFSFSSAIDCSRLTNPISDCFSFCRKQYLGEKNFYNSTTENCEPSPLCKEGEEYDIKTNRCIIQSGNDLGNITINNTDPDDNNDNNNELLPPKINCINGYYPPNSSLCICYPGWISDESASSDSNEITKCSIETDFNSTNNKDKTDVSTSDLSLILSIAIPSLIGVILVIFLITCFKTKCRKTKIKVNDNSNIEEGAKERPIIIHLSNDVSERMQMKETDNMTSIQKLGHSTPPRTTTQNPFGCIDKHSSTQNNQKDYRNEFGYQTPDKKHRKPHANLIKQNTPFPKKTITPKSKGIQFTDEDWIENDVFTLRNNYNKHQYYSNPHKRIKPLEVYQKPTTSLTNSKISRIPQFFEYSNDKRYSIHPTFVFQGSNISDLEN